MSSKVYDKPDRSVAILWECEAGGNWVLLEDGRVCVMHPTFIGGPVEHRAPSRWRPYIANNPEPWPPRKLMPRRCWATVGAFGKRAMFIHLPDDGELCFRCIDSNYQGNMWKAEKDLLHITFIDPEQEAVEVTQ